MHDLAVILVTWNVRDLIEEALRSLLDDLDGSGLQVRVLAVDSASSDGTPDLIRTAFPQVELIACEENLGFTRGNNLALRRLGAEGDEAALPRAVYLLNPDTITQPGATRALFDALFAAPDVGMVGARLSYGDGRFQHGAFMFPGLRQIWAEFFPTPGRFLEGRFNGRYPRALYAGDVPFEVDFTLGATMMLRREVIQQTGILDEGFFMYCEEVDWAWRIRRAGWRILLVPTAHVVHLGGQSSSQVRARSQRYLWESRLRLYGKHYPRWKQSLARGLVALGMRRRLRALQSDQTSDAAAREELRATYQALLVQALGR